MSLPSSLHSTLEGAFCELGGDAIDEHLVGKVAVVLPGDGDEGPGIAELDLALEVDGGGAVVRMHVSTWYPKVRLDTKGNSKLKRSPAKGAYSLGSYEHMGQQRNESLSLRHKSFIINNL
jgi:hypothetical protein